MNHHRGFRWLPLLGNKDGTRTIEMILVSTVLLKAKLGTWFKQALTSGECGLSLYACMCTSQEARTINHVTGRGNGSNLSVEANFREEKKPDWLEKNSRNQIEIGGLISAHMRSQGFKSEL